MTSFLLSTYKHYLRRGNMNHLVLKTKTGTEYLYLDSVVKGDVTYLIVAGLITGKVLDLPLDRFEVCEQYMYKIRLKHYEVEQ